MTWLVSGPQASNTLQPCRTLPGLGGCPCLQQLGAKGQTPLWARLTLVLHHSLSASPTASSTFPVLPRKMLGEPWRLEARGWGMFPLSLSSPRLGETQQGSELGNGLVPPWWGGDQSAGTEGRAVAGQTGQVRVRGRRGAGSSGPQMLRGRMGQGWPPSALGLAQGLAHRRCSDATC